MGLFHTLSHSRAQDTESAQLPFLSHRQSHRQLEFCWWPQTQCSHSRGSGTEILEASSGRKQNGKLDEKLTNVCVHVMSQNVLWWVGSFCKQSWICSFFSFIAFFFLSCFMFLFYYLSANSNAHSRASNEDLLSKECPSCSVGTGLQGTVVLPAVDLETDSHCHRHPRDSRNTTPWVSDTGSLTSLTFLVSMCQ